MADGCGTVFPKKGLLMNRGTTMKSTILAAGLAVSVAMLLSCTSSDQPVSGAGGTNPSTSQSPTPAQCDLNNAAPVARAADAKPAAPTVAPPTAKDAPAAGEKAHALHNVHTIGAKMISGGVPEGDAAFDELKTMGVKTIISVDGATPDVKSAEARGMRYVHIPITYAEATKEQQLEIARAVRDLPGPVYIHCHHGKHRSPAAAASAAVLLGEATPEEAVAFMKNAGTAASYTGLYSCVSTASVADAATLDAAPATFPSVQKPKGITGAMVEIDHIYEHLGAVRDAGWTTPADHPDLVPAAEAGRLADFLRFSGEDAEVKQLGDDFAARLADAVSKATALEEGIVKHEGKELLEGKWKLVVASCKDCHAKYRDKKVW